MLEVRHLSKVFFEQNDPQKPGLIALYDMRSGISVKSSSSKTIRRNPD